MDIQVIILIVAAIAIAGFVWWMRRRNKQPFWYMSPIARGFNLMGVSGDNAVTPVTTADGIKIYHEPDTPTVSSNAVDQGAREVFRRVLCKYSNADRSRHTAIKVVVLKGELSPESRTPSFRVAIITGNPYFNTEWDMMRGSDEEVHYVLAAGQLLGAGEPYGDVIIIPSTDDVAFISTIVDYELEHALLAWYDGDEFDRTKIHGSGTGHPIIPDTCPAEFAPKKAASPIVFSNESNELLLVK